MRLDLTPGYVLPLLVLAACGGDVGRKGDNSAVLSEAGRVEFEELPGDPIVGIEYLARRPGGGYVVADRLAGRVRLFDAAGRIDGVMGSPGEGPGELIEPAGAIELEGGQIVVVQRGSPRLTIFNPDSSTTISELPGQYGYWVEQLGEGFVAGVATRDTRFAIFDEAGTPKVAFASRDPAVSETPFWIFFARDHAAVIGDLIAVNTSLYPTLRLFDLDGDSVGVLGEAPPDWVPASAPPVDDVSAPASRERIAGWSRSFTVVRQVVSVSDSVLVVEYGRHDPQDLDPYFVSPTTADVYSRSGAKLASGLELPGPVVGGGSHLLVLVAEPPSSWTIAALEWVDGDP